MKQMTFSDVEYSGRKKVTQKEKFLGEMDVIIPWEEAIEKRKSSVRSKVEHVFLIVKRQYDLISRSFRACWRD